MLSRNELKYYSSLLEKKFRTEENKFIIDGKRIVSEGLHSRFKCEIVFINNSFAAANKEIIDLINSKNIRLEITNNHDIDKLSDTRNTQGIVAVFSKKAANEIKGNTIVALDNISDPGNAGTLMRNCDWFGIDDIILSENTVELYNPKVLRAGMGTVFHINIIETKNFYNLLREYRARGYSIILTDIMGDNLFGFSFPDKCIIVFSNEASGPSEEIFDIADFKVNIPRYGKAESLNVASASAVVLAEVAKVRK